MTTSIYPDIKQIDKETENLINNNINTQRAQKLISLIQSKQDKLNHYIKVHSRWRKAYKVLRIINLTCSSLVGGSILTLGIITTNGIIIPGLVLALLGGYGTIESVIMEGMNIGLIKKKKLRFKNKIDILTSSINKMHYYFEKARQDGLITLEEIEGFNLLMTELENNLNLENSTKVETNDKIDFLEMKSQAQKIAKKEVMEEIKMKLVKEQKEKLLQRVEA
jgi:hypothetical protein